MELAWIYTISEKKEDNCLKISVVDKTIGQLLFFLVAQFPPTHPFYDQVEGFFAFFQLSRRL